METGKIIGNRYEIIETVGKGGMAIVYKAKCTVLNRYVALKVLRPEFREDKDFITRFQAEAQSAGGLSHPNIVSIYDVCQDGDLDYIVMEYVEGITLKQYLEATGPLPWREAVDYAAQICAGLEHAHKKGIVHKDIKPHNIIITREGTLKITDFGIAKVMSSGTITTGNANMGSVHYFSPEQARGGYTDYKTDIYSLGVVLYEMVTGTLPFRGDTAIAIAMQHIEKEPAPPCMLNPDLPESLENVILRAMCKDQALRYDSVGQLLIDLKKVYTGHAVEFVSEYESDATSITPIVSTEEKDPSSLSSSSSSKKRDIVGVIAGSLTGLVLVVALFFLGYYLIGRDSHNEIEVPNFVNMTVEAAQNMIVNSELKIVVDGEVISDSVEAGKIISQSPEAGKQIAEDGTIKVVVSKGEGEFPMPDLLNRKQEDAEKILKDKDLLFTIVEEPSDTIPKEYVVRQIPEAGTYIDKATTVTVYVSAGEEDAITTVPNLLGMTLSEAKAALLDAKLTWGQIIEASSNKTPGTVIAQSVRAGYEVKEKSPVDLRVSKGSSSATATPSATPTDGNTETKAPTILPPNASGE